MRSLPDMDDNIVDLWTFRDLISNNMIKHNPTHQKHACDINMRLDTQQNQATIEKRKEAARFKRGNPSVEEVQLSNNPPPPK